MHTRIENWSKLTPEELLSDVRNWLGGLALLNEDLVKLEAVKYSEISDENPFAKGRLNHMGKAAYGIPGPFRINARPSGDAHFKHIRRIDGHVLDVSQMAGVIGKKNNDGARYNPELHGVAWYTSRSPFEGGSYIEVKPRDETEGGGLAAYIESTGETTHPIAGEQQTVRDAIQVPLSKLNLVTFEVVKLGGQAIVEQRTRL